MIKLSITATVIAVVSCLATAASAREAEDQVNCAALSSADARAACGEEVKAAARIYEMNVSVDGEQNRFDARYR